MAKIDDRYNEMVTNIENITREARHMNVLSGLYICMNKLVYILKEVGANSVNADKIMREDYYKSKMLDVMDFIMDRWFDKFNDRGVNYRYVRSVYDAVHEFYFED